MHHARPSTIAGPWLLFVLALLFAATGCASVGTADPLPSWNDGPTKQAIVRFVGDVTREGSPAFAPPAERIAVFDNDGTLWSEQPLYHQLAFTVNRIKALAPQHPEWTTQAPFSAVLKGDPQALAAAGAQGMAELVMATHTGMTTEQFSQSVSAWISTAQHPRFKRPYTELIYQPMLELLAYLRGAGFKTLLAFGNSDGDLQMLQWTAGGAGPRLAALVHHTDADREWAYDRQSPVGRLDKALDEARAKG